MLLAEDTRANQRLVVRILGKRGHAVSVAEDGCRAVEMVQNDDFDVILMDVQMPVMDGFEATRAIRAIEPSIPIIAMTAHAMKGDHERCLASGMNAYVPKPVNSQELIRLVEMLAGSRTEGS